MNKPMQIETMSLDDVLKITVKIVPETEEDQVYDVMYRCSPDNFRMKSMDEQGEIVGRIARAIRMMRGEI